jgi:hypothetical protein
MAPRTLEPALASSIFESRAALRAAWGKRYGERIAEYRVLIEEVRGQTRESVLQAAQRIVKSIRRNPARMAFLAAALDLVEESVQ